MTITDEGYRLCDQENQNLRNVLRWAATKLNAEDREALAARLAKTIDDGGVTEDEVDDTAEGYNRMAKLLAKIAVHFDGIENMDLREAPPLWFQRAEHLLNCAREFELKEPLMKRVGNYPNVYALVKGEVK